MAGVRDEEVRLVFTSPQSRCASQG
jgi:hypothetical protein